MSETKVIRDIEIDAYLYDCVAIEPLAIAEEYTRVAADLAYWNSRYAQAQRDMMLAKVAAERVEAQAYLEIRSNAVVRGEKLTEKTLESMVLTRDDVVDARNAHIEADGRRIQMNGVLDAVRTKRDMLVSLGAHMRAEMQGDPSLRAMSAEQRLHNFSPR